jgi:hypothetical protein
MSLFDKYKLKEDLTNGVYTIVFEKVDGTIREMSCTLHPSKLPQLLTENTNPRPENPDVIAVWDLEKNGWRSIRIDSIQTVVQEGIYF